jgi:hypothetical protein
MTHVSSDDNRMPTTPEVRGAAEGFSATTDGVTVGLEVGSAPEALSRTVRPASTMSRPTITGVGTGEGPAEGYVEGYVEGTVEGPVEGYAEGSAEGDTDGATEGYMEGTAEGVPGFVTTVAPPMMTVCPFWVGFSITVPPPEMTVFPPESISWPGAGVGTAEGATEGMAEGDTDGATEGRTEGAAEGPGVKFSCAQTAGTTTARNKPAIAA